MTREKQQRVKVVEAQTGAEFEESFNNATASIVGEYEIRLDINKPYLAYIFYTREREIAETLRDEYNLAGIKLTCKGCMYLEKSSDKRRSRLLCELFQTYTRADREACELFYRKLQPVEALGTGGLLLDLTAPDEIAKKEEV